MRHEFETAQEEFWAGGFGDDYSARNAGSQLLASNQALFEGILSLCPDAKSLIEFGANTGMNLSAIQQVRTDMKLEAVEINRIAVEQLERLGGISKVHYGSILEFQAKQNWDVTLVKGVLIHINPEHLPRVYDVLVQASKRYVVLVEYYNPTPVEVSYRGHDGKLFKRDFAGEILDAYPELRIVDYGFIWHRDSKNPQDDVTWFVLEKTDN